MDQHSGRAARVIENEYLRVVVLAGGGHLAAVIDKQSGVNPLWAPSWPSIEPSAFDARHAAIYGSGVDASLLASLMGHNLCLDIFGGPSEAESNAGLPVHGEGSLVTYDLK